MKKHTIALATSTLLLAACGNKPNMQAGQWSVDFETRMGGVTLPAVSAKQCLGSDNLVPKQARQAKACQHNNVKVSGDTVSWDIQCDNSEGKGSITYYGDTLKGEMTLTTMAAGIPVTVDSAISGLHIGDCK